MRKTLKITAQAAKALFSNKVRTALTILGIVIGIGSVIGLVSLTEGVKVNISGQIATLGAKTITAMQSFNLNQTPAPDEDGGFAPPRGGNSINGGVVSFTLEDYSDLADPAQNPHLAFVAGTVAGSGVFNDEYKFSVQGAMMSIFPIRNLEISEGRLFTETDIEQRNPVIVIGHDLAEDLFGEEEAVGQTLTIGLDKYEVVGQLAKASGNSFSDPNDIAYVPYTAAMDTFKTEKFGTLIAEAKSEELVDQAKSDIEQTLLANRGLTDMKFADFGVNTSSDLLSSVANITDILASLLSGIAGISLLVGGIGIMNVMLVSVTERTKEIGLRKAVGATTANILVQFLIESVILTFIGGVLGILLGMLMGYAVGEAIGFDAVVTTEAIILAVGISTLEGLVFGIYPAIKAARLNPIVALRYE